MIYKMHFEADWSADRLQIPRFTTPTLLAQSFTTHIAKANLLQDTSWGFFAFIVSLIEHLQFLQGNVPLRCLLNGTEETHFMSWFDDLTPKVKSKWLDLKMLMLGCEEF